MRSFSIFDSGNPQNPFVHLTDKIISIEENADDTLTYWFERIGTNELVEQKTLSTYATFTGLENFKKVHKGSLVEIVDTDNKTSYILYKKYYKTDEENKPVVLSEKAIAAAKITLL